MDDKIKRVKRDLKYYSYKKLEIYKDLEKSIPKIYVDVNSDKQISTFYKAYLKDPENLRIYY